MTTDYRIVPSLTPSPARLARARRYSTIEGAVDAMGEGVVLASGGRLVAFHERHLVEAERRA